MSAGRYTGSHEPEDGGNTMASGNYNSSAISRPNKHWRDSEFMGPGTNWGQECKRCHCPLPWGPAVSHCVFTQMS